MRILVWFLRWFAPINSRARNWAVNKYNEPFIEMAKEIERQYQEHLKSVDQTIRIHLMCRIQDRYIYRITKGETHIGDVVMNKFDAFVPVERDYDAEITGPWTPIN